MEPGQPGQSGQPGPAAAAATAAAAPKTLRPIDELAEAAAVHYRQNASITLLVDSAGVEYRPPKWLVELIETAERRGVLWAQHEIREALGLDEMLVNHAQAIHSLSREIAALQKAASEKSASEKSAAQRSEQPGTPQPGTQQPGTPGVQPCPVCQPAEQPGAETIKVRIATADPDADQHGKV